MDVTPAHDCWWATSKTRTQNASSLFSLAVCLYVQTRTALKATSASLIYLHKLHFGFY